MSSSNLTLIIDGNWLLMSRLAILDKRFSDDKELNKNLKLLMVRSIGVVLRTFPDIDNVIFVSDGGSWRNQVPVPEFLKSHNIEYKGTRVKSEEVNWELLFENFNEFQSVLVSESGITVCHENMIEGDDWCYYWSKLLNDQNTNVLIWSSDRDLTQLVTVKDNGCFTAWWNSKIGIIEEDSENSEIDFLFNPYKDKNNQILSNLEDKSTKVTKINPKKILLDKIIRGDISDNVKPILLRKTKNASRYFKVSAKDIDYSLDIWNEKAVDEYVSRIYNLRNYRGKEIFSLKDNLDHFRYNRRLVALDLRNYPEDIKAVLERYQDYSKSASIREAESKLNAEANDMENVLENL